jgi:hypothetical protein
VGAASRGWMTAKLAVSRPEGDDLSDTMHIRAMSCIHGKFISSGVCMAYGPFANDAKDTQGRGCAIGCVAGKYKHDQRSAV